jgi:hypothetical protein
VLDVIAIGVGVVGVRCAPGYWCLVLVPRASCLSACAWRSGPAGPVAVAALPLPLLLLPLPLLLAPGSSWLLAAGCWLLAAGCWQLPGRLLLAAGCCCCWLLLAAGRRGGRGAGRTGVLCIKRVVLEA